MFLHDTIGPINIINLYRCAFSILTILLFICVPELHRAGGVKIFLLFNSERLRKKEESQNRQNAEGKREREMFEVDIGEG